MASGFLSSLIVSPSGDNKWILRDSLIFNYVNGGVTSTITVPSGFVSDLASIPKVLRPVLNRNGKSRSPSVLHDYLYSTAKYSRKESDCIYYKALRSVGMSWVVANVYHLGVRLFGSSSYNK